MKKIITALTVLFVAAAFSFAEAAPAPSPAPTPAPSASAAPVVKAVKGTIETVIKADTAKKTENAIKVKSANGKTTVTVFVPATAKIVGADKKASTFAKLAKGSKVEVKFTEGKADEATEVALLK